MKSSLLADFEKCCFVHIDRLTAIIISAKGLAHHFYHTRMSFRALTSSFIFIAIRVKIEDSTPCSSAKHSPKKQGLNIFPGGLCKLRCKYCQYCYNSAVNSLLPVCFGEKRITSLLALTTPYNGIGTSPHERKLRVYPCKPVQRHIVHRYDLRLG